MKIQSFARTMITIILVTVVCCILSIIPTAGDYVSKLLIKTIGKVDIFKNWFSILVNNVEWNELGSILDGTKPLKSLISEPSSPIRNLQGSSEIIIAGFMLVISKAILESFITGTCSAIAKEFLPGWTLLCNMIGIVLGLTICSYIGSVNVVAQLRAGVYSLSVIITMCVGIAILWFSTSKYNRSRGKRLRRRFSNTLIFFLGNLLFGVITVTASTLYISTIGLVAGGIISRITVIWVSIIYIIVLAIDYLRTKYRELRRANYHITSWRDFI